jgi:hypothetical protein
MEAKAQAAITLQLLNIKQICYSKAQNQKLGT